MAFAWSMTKTLIAAAALTVAGATAIGVAVADAPMHPGPSRAAAAAGTTCPRDTTTLRPDAVARATETALAEAARLYKGTNLKGARVMKAIRATVDPDRGGYAKVKCGRKIQARSVVIYLDFPAERSSASLSQGVVVVSATSHGYTAWARVH